MKNDRDRQTWAQAAAAESAQTDYLLQGPWGAEGTGANRLLLREVGHLTSQNKNPSRETRADNLEVREMPKGPEVGEWTLFSSALLSSLISCLHRGN